MLIPSLAMVMLLTLSVFATPEASPVQQGKPGPLLVAGEPTTALAVDPATGLAHYAVAGGDLFIADGAGGWDVTGISPERESVIVDSDDQEILWAGTGQECYRGGGASASLMRSEDGGATWTEAGNQGFTPLVSWSDPGVVIAHDCSGLRLSFDGGHSWVMPDSLPLGSQVTAFTVVRGPASSEGLRVAAGVTGEGGTSELYLVTVRSPDEIVVDGPILTYYGIGSAGHRNDNSLVVGAPQGVLMSNDEGESWAVSRNGLASTTLEQDPIEFFPTDLEPGSFGLPALLVHEGIIYVGGVDGVYRFSPESNGWERIIELDGPVEALAIEPGTQALLVDVREGDVLRVAAGAGATPVATPAT